MKGKTGIEKSFRFEDVKQAQEAVSILGKKAQVAMLFDFREHYQVIYPRYES